MLIPPCQRIRSEQAASSVATGRRLGGGMIREIGVRVGRSLLVAGADKIVVRTTGGRSEWTIVW